MKYRFYKIENYWLIDIKWWPKFLLHHLAMVCGADEMLDKVSNGADEVVIEISTKYFQGYDECLIREMRIGLFLGSIYSPMLMKLKNEITKPNQLWLCFVTLFVFGHYPKKIYFKAHKIQPALEKIENSLKRIILST